MEFKIREAKQLKSPKKKEIRKTICEDATTKLSMPSARASRYKLKRLFVLLSVLLSDTLQMTMFRDASLSLPPVLSWFYHIHIFKTSFICLIPSTKAWKVPRRREKDGRKVTVHRDDPADRTCLSGACLIISKIGSIALHRRRVFSTKCPSLVKVVSTSFASIFSATSNRGRLSEFVSECRST